jgi:poly(3-hydroxybutyrate) depolymerase
MQKPVIVLLLWASSASAEVTPLPSFNIDINETSVSGLSSGGYMAVQFHVAHSTIIKGAGIVAGGPYFCAQDNQERATSVCSCTGLFACEPRSAAGMVRQLHEITAQNAASGAIDPTSGLADDRVWLFSGRKDSVVPPPVVEALELYYTNYAAPPNIFLKKDLAAEHAMPTDFFGNACDVRGEPFINDCDYDAAGELLKWIYGGLNEKNPAALSGRLIEFNQGEFIVNPTAHGMWESGWAYVPAKCEKGEKCRVHIAFHGCRQYPGAPFAGGRAGSFGDTFAKNTGYNKWADTNNMIVLYPQANALTQGTRLPRTNPLGCWDWWGFDDANYAKQSGRQIAAVKGMLDRLAGASTPPPSSGVCETATNLEHLGARRAYTWFFWLYYATGSDDYLGMTGIATTTLKETSPGSYERVASCP